LLLGEDPQPQRHQVTELPRIEPLVTEYRRHTLKCLACGAKTQNTWPADMPSGDFGPRLQATIGYLSGRMGMSQRDLAETMTAVFHTDISLGSISAAETIVSEALSASITAGLPTSARAIATRCCCPPLNSFGRWSIRSLIPTMRKAVSARSLRSGALTPR
jgi:hypothetical protein